jgi:hypothetical protein
MVATDHLRHLGVHMPQIGNLPGGGSFGNYTQGNLALLYDAAGVRPRDCARGPRPVVTLKRQRPQGVSVPAALTTAARDVVELGCILHVQEVDHNPQFIGPTTGMSESEWASEVLNGMMNGLDAWLTEIGADRRRVLVSYGNERDMGAESGGGLKVWNGQPGSTDVDGEWFHREGAFMEAVRDRLHCLPAFGNDASEVGQLRTLPRRLDVYREWGVVPAAMVYHGYGSGGHHAVHVPLMHRIMRRAGFAGRLIGGEVARRVDTSAGDAADRDKSGEWWRQYAHEVAQFRDVAGCFFLLNEAASVSQILAAFRAPVPTGATTGPDPEAVGTKAWGIITALLDEDDRAADPDGSLAAIRAARDAR